LRDRVTEQHTQRVTEMTVRLAREMGMSEEELVHVRRGALLHDIGKIGVPDASWAARPHPGGWERGSHPRPPWILRHIATRPAAGVYAHHEHWDGQRPLGPRSKSRRSADLRIADVWDAIHASDRPYRHALPANEACDQIRSLAGTHLDPKVVEVFLRMKDEFCRPETPSPPP
jgi:HD-GYP domain-containing protein (c-di-GMP phosphodiesterase class II)